MFVGPETICCSSPFKANSRPTRESCSEKVLFPSSHADVVTWKHVLTQKLVKLVLIILNCLCLQLISNGLLSSWVLLMILPWKSWPGRCLMTMKWQVGFLFFSTLLTLFFLLLLCKNSVIAPLIFLNNIRHGPSQWRRQ